MQLEMESAKTPVNTPKSNKKTPKKVKATPLKKEETPNTPKSNKKSPKGGTNPQQQQKKTPKSNSKFAKKQKLGDNTFKGIEAEKKGKNQSDSEISKSPNNDVELFFPKRMVSVKDILSVFGDCESANFFGKVIIRCKPNNISKKIEQLQEIKISGRSLPFKLNADKKTDPLKRIIFMPSPEHKENVRKFFDAKSIDQIINRRGFVTKIYELTFESSEEAEEASNKQFNVGETSYSLRPFYVHSRREHGTEKGSNSSNKKSHVKAPQRQGQVKRKVKDEEESDDENDDELMKGIDMDDDDENEDDDDDNNDDEESEDDE